MADQLRGAALVTFEKERVDEDTHSDQDALLIRTGIFWEVYLKCIGIREDFSGQALWFFQNQTPVVELR